MHVFHCRFRKFQTFKYALLGGFRILLSRDLHGIFFPFKKQYGQTPQKIFLKNIKMYVQSLLFLCKTIEHIELFDIMSLLQCVDISYYHFYLQKLLVHQSTTPKKYLRLHPQNIFHSTLLYININYLHVPKRSCFGHRHGVQKQL